MAEPAAKAQEPYWGPPASHNEEREGNDDTDRGSGTGGVAVSEFSVVPDKERRKVTRGRRSAFTEALRAGKTVFMAGKAPGALNGYYSHFRHDPANRRLVVTKHEMDGVSGLLCWLEKREANDA